MWPSPDGRYICIASVVGPQQDGNQVITVDKQLRGCGKEVRSALLTRQVRAPLPRVEVAVVAVSSLSSHLDTLDTGLDTLDTGLDTGQHYLASLAWSREGELR